MGSYYQATIIEPDNSAYMYNTHSLNIGLKLMEHSYVNNEYCKHIISLLHNNPQPLVWLCDYHESDDTTKHTWVTAEELNISEALDDFKDNNYWIINHTKKCYIDMHKLSNLYTSDWHIHPIPILCNSDTQSQGGGDFHPEDSRRATWCEDIISSIEPSNQEFIEFTDVTEDCLFYE